MRLFMMILAVALVGSTGLAQNLFKQRRNRIAPANQAKPKIDFSVEPAAAPGEEVDVNEFQLKRKELAGQVVKLEFDRVIDLKQSNNGYAARVTFESVRMAEGLVLMIPEEGLDLFKDMADRDARSPLRKKVYVEVMGGSVSRALGTRYRKNEPEGERYSW